MVHKCMQNDEVPLILTNIRPVQCPQDLKHLMDIDLKCFEDPWDEIDWEEVYSTNHHNKHKVLIGTTMGVPISFIVWYEDGVNGCVKRFGVRPGFQGKGVGTKLLDAVETSVRHNQCAQLFVEVSESMVYEMVQDRTCISVPEWLGNRGFKATIVKQGGGLYCGQIEDLIVFEKTFTEGG